MMRSDALSVLAGKSGLSQVGCGGFMRRVALPLLVVVSLAGCAIKTGAEAIALDEQINLCRVIRTAGTTWRMCRTHPSVTPELLHEARLIRDRLGVPLTTAIRTLTSWNVYGLRIDTADQIDEWRAALDAR
jgi:hypothetical protein